MSEASNECDHGCMWWDRHKPPECSCWRGLDHLPMPFSSRQKGNHA